MQIEKAIFTVFNLILVIDGFDFYALTKYSILEEGFAYLIAANLEADRYLTDNPPKLLSRPDLTLAGGDRHAGLTDNVQAVALAYHCWWSMNGEPFLNFGHVQIPSASEAEIIVRGRIIKYSGNRKYSGLLAGESHPFDAEKQSARQRQKVFQYFKSDSIAVSIPEPSSFQGELPIETSPPLPPKL